MYNKYVLFYIVKVSFNEFGNIDDWLSISMNVLYLVYLVFMHIMLYYAIQFSQLNAILSSRCEI
jgi:hypothetical protein